MNALCSCGNDTVAELTTVLSAVLELLDPKEYRTPQQQAVIRRANNMLAGQSVTNGVKP